MEKIKTASDLIGENGLPILGTTVNEIITALKNGESGYLQDAVYSGVLINGLAKTSKRAEVIKKLVVEGINKGTLSVYTRLAGLYNKVGLPVILDNLETYKTATRTASIWGNKALANNAPALRKVLARIKDSDLSKDDLNSIREDFGLPVKETTETEVSEVKTTIDTDYIESVVASVLAAGLIDTLIASIGKVAKVSLIGDRPKVKKAA